MATNEVGAIIAKEQAYAHIRDIRNSHPSAKSQCVVDLCLTDPRLDKTRIEQTNGGLLEDSYKWILSHPDFRKWRDDEHGRLFWIKGDAGKG